MEKMKIAYLLSHPIQYQVPMIRQINAEPDLYLKVFYCSDISVGEHFDEGFGKKFAWDVPLLEGYDYEFLPAIGDSKKLSWARPFNYGLMRALKRGRFDTLWVHGYNRLFFLQAIVCAKMMGLKVFIRDEAWAKSKKRPQNNFLWKKMAFLVLNRLVDAFLAIGKCNRDYYLANGIGAEKIFLAPYSVDNDFFTEKGSLADVTQLRKQLNISEDRKVILYASKLSRRKCVLDLISAFAMLKKNDKDKNSILVIVGSGELEGEASKITQEFGMQNEVVMVGFKNQTDLPAYYKLADVFVLPSENEPWGLAVNEAMCCGAAIVASDEVGAAFDLVKDNQNGYIFKTGDVNDLAEKLETSLVNSEQFGQKSREIIANWGFSQIIEGLKLAQRHCLK